MTEHGEADLALQRELNARITDLTYCPSNVVAYSALSDYLQERRARHDGRTGNVGPRPLPAGT